MADPTFRDDDQVKHATMHKGSIGSWTRIASTKSGLKISCTGHIITSQAIELLRQNWVDLAMALQPSEEERITFSLVRLSDATHSGNATRWF